MIERYSRPQMKKVWSEQSKFEKWLLVEIAVCEAYTELGVIPKADIEKIRLAYFNLERIEQILQETHHDVTAFLNAVAENLGPESRFIHLGLTSSDIMDTALSLQMVEAADILKNDMDELISAIIERAVEHKDTLMMGRTHGVHAEPISFGLKLAIWIEEMKRNQTRLAEAREVISVGKISGAVGTYATVPPEIEVKACARLGLTPAPVSNQILQRDRHAQFVSTLALIGSSLEKFATELRALQKTEVHEVEEPFGKGQTGSSAMPHKRNPELCERVCGIARLIRGYSVTAMENVALWHERDISHSSTERITLPDACLVLDYALSIFTGIIKGMRVFPERMKQNVELTHGLIFSQRVMLALIDKGMKRQDAYEIVQNNAMKVWEENKDFLTLLKADKGVADTLPKGELESLFDYGYYLRYVDHIFERLGLNKAAGRPRTKAEPGELAPRAL